MEHVRVLWNLLWPVIFYGVMVDLASLLFKNMGTLSCTFLGALTSAPFLWRAYAGEKKKRERLHLQECLLCVLGGIGGCILVNTLIKVSGIGRIFPGFSQVSGQLYKPPLWLQICAMGAGIPLAEELVFRGLVFAGARRAWPFGKAAVVSALLFGVYHGNILQGVYGFLMGMMFAWVMEQKGTILAPVLMHMSANLTSVVMTAIGSMR